MASSNPFARFLKTQIRSLRQVLRQVRDMLLGVMPPSTSIRFFNFLQSIKGNVSRYGFLEDENTYFVDDGIRRIHFLEKMRGFGFYPKGTKTRINDLAKSYFLEHVEFSDGDVVIDCGANIGELYFWFDSRPQKIRYISFEPSPAEFACLQKNASASDALNNQIALSDKKGMQQFFLSTAGADSSLSEPSSGHTEVIEVQTCTLDNFIDANDIKKIKLLKLEAEGHEVEILNGAKSILDRVEYIAVDGGEERGVSALSTIEALCNRLIPLGYPLEKLDIKSGMGRALFRKQAQLD